MTCILIKFRLINWRKNWQNLRGLRRNDCQIIIKAFIGSRAMFFIVIWNFFTGVQKSSIWNNILVTAKCRWSKTKSNKLTDFNQNWMYKNSKKLVTEMKKSLSLEKKRTVKLTLFKRQKKIAQNQNGGIQNTTRQINTDSESDCCSQ
jgi:hypothetical protein